MKKLLKVSLIVICIALLTVLVGMAVHANSMDDADLKSVQVSTGGSVKMRFTYNSFGDAEKMVVEYSDNTIEYPVAELSGNYVDVPLSPDQMADTIAIYAVSASGQAGEPTYYSVRQYANEVLAKDSYASYHDDMRALLNWGAMADVYFNEKSSSMINLSMYSSGTNPVDGVTESFAEKTDGVVHGNAVKVAGYQVFLEPGNTTMRMYFTYEGDVSDLKGSVTKQGSAAVSAPVIADKDVAGRYYVNIYNVGVAVFDKAYTVTVSAGEDSASLTKTMLEYLNGLAVDETTSVQFTEEQKDLAKAMYQFYTRTRNMTVADCDHEITHKLLVQIDGKYAEQKICSLCFENVATHNLVSSNKVVNPDGSVAYEYVCNCDECNGAVVYRKNLNAAVYHADVTTATSTIIATGDYVEDRVKAPVSTIVEDGMVYTHVETDGNQVETVIKAENVPATAVIYVKYRLNNGNAPTGWIHSNVKITTADGVEHLISDGTVENEDLAKRHDGWIVARVNAKGAFDREGLVAGENSAAYTFTIVHSDDLDISYFVAEPTEDNVNGLPYIYSMGEDYYMHCNTVLGSYIDSQWRKINGTSGVKQNDPFTPENTRTPEYIEEAAAPKVVHDIEFGKTANADGTTTYTYTCNCEECAGAVLYRKTLNSAVYHADITTVTSTVTEGEGQADVTQEITEDGMLYTHVATHGNYVQTVITAENVPATAVIYVKYRLANGTTPEGYMHSRVSITSADGVEHLISDGKTENTDLVKRHNSDLNNDGWVVARVNAKGAFDREGLTAGANAKAYTITITHRDDLDISYIVAEPTEDNVNGLPYVYSMGDDYYLHVSTYLPSYIASQWRLINGTSGVKQNDPFTAPENTRTPEYIEDEVVVEKDGHDVVFAQTANEDGTVTYTYTCNCDECAGAVLYRKTLNSTVFHADITTITAAVTQGDGEAEVSQEIAEDGMLYTHVATHGNWVTTTISSDDVPAGMVMYVKYRLANGGTPEGYLASQVNVTTSDGNVHLVSSGTVENADLIKNHKGWLVARVNVKGNFTNEGLTSGAVVSNVTMTITHRDDLDIAYFVAEPTEDNVNGLPYVYSMGDDYYLHSSTYLGWYTASQWRLINGTSGVKQNDPFTPPAPTRTPVYVEDEVVVEKDGHDVVFAQTANEDGTVTYTYTCNCEDCGGKLLYRKTLNANVFHADITTVTAAVTQGEGEAEVTQEIAEDGMLYTHVATNGNWVTTTISSEDVPAGMVMYVKYRLANGGTPEGYLASQVNVTTSDGNVHLVSSGTVENADLIKNHKGWLVARVNVKGNFTTEGLTSGAVVSKVTMTITHRDDLDIAYFIAEPTEDNVNGLPYVYSMGDDYYLHSSTYLGWYTASQWRLINGTSGVKQNDPFTPPAPTRTPVYVEEAPAGEVEHEIVSSKSVNANGTTTYTYTCNCAECDGNILYKKTLNSAVYHADITSITAAVTQGDGEAEVSQEIAEDGMLYTHVATHGNWVQTTISADNVPAGMVMYLKYRLANGGTPEGYLASQVNVTTSDGKVHLVSSGKVENADLIKRHTGWVVGRINVKGNFTNEGLTSGAVVSNVTLTITHRDDLDIAYFIAEPTEDNVNGLPYVYSMGDDYYMVQGTAIGTYSDSQWRLINGTSGVKQNDPFTPPTSTRTPIYVEEDPCANGHTPVVDQAVDATCTTSGLTEGSHCSVCGEIFTAQQTVPAIGHTPGSTVIENEVAVGCENDGSYDEVVYCTICNEKISSNTVYTPATGHKEGESAIINRVEASCSQEGSYDNVIYCSVCGGFYNVETVIIPKTPHTNTRKYNDNCHWDECSVCGEITNKEEHTGWTRTTTTSGSSTTYSYECAECDGVWGTKTFSSSAVYNADLTTVTSDGKTSIAIIDEMIYVHAAAKGSGQKTTTTFTATNVPIGIPLFMKYRINNGATPTANLVVKVSYNVGGTSYSVHYGNTSATDLAKRHYGWVVGRVNIKSDLNNKGLTAGSIADSITVTIEHYDDIDIAYFVTDSLENNSNVFPQMYADGDIYYMHQSTQFGSYAANQWRQINSNLTSTTTINDSNLVHPAYPDGSDVTSYDDPNSGHRIRLSKTHTSDSTTYTYTCVCAECGGKVLSTKTFKKVVYNANVASDITTTGTKSVQIDHTGMLYTHIATGGSQRTTTITASNVTVGVAMFMKYRLANGGTPTGSLRVQVEYHIGETKHVVNNATTTAADLASRHLGWVVGRINYKGAIDNNSSLTAGTTKATIVITIIHSDDLDIAFLLTDPSQNNTSVFPQLYADGEIYYMHQATAFGSYIADQWRQINADYSTTTIKDSTLKHPSRPDGTDIPKEEPAPDMTEDFEEVKDTEVAPYKPKITYGSTLTGFENADLLKSAANINMFDSSCPIRIDYIYHFTSNKTIEFTITDYFGNPISRIYIKGIAGESKKISVGFMNHATGYFTIAVDGVALDYYVVTPEVNERTLTDSPFAMDAVLTGHLGDDLTLIDSYAAAMRLAGVTWVRERFAWSYYQTANNGDSYTYSTSYINGLESKLQVVKNRGLNVLMTFSTAPNWALQLAYNNGGENITVGSNKPNYLGTYGTQLAIYEAAKKVATQLGQEVDIIELMNEPDHDAFLDLAEQYASWFKSAALGVVDAGTGMKISLAGLCNAATDFTPILLNSDVLKYASVFNYHTHIYDYDYASSSKVTDLGASQSVRDFSVMLDLYGVNAPVWISESGMKLPSTTPTADQKKIQAPYIVSSAVQSLSYGVDKYFWFLATNYTEVNNGVAGDFGSFSKDNKPYPTVAAYSVMTSVLGEAEYIGELKDLPNEKARGYLFKTGNGDETVAVVWMSEGSATYTFSTTGSVKVTDLMGKETTKNTIGGQISVSIGLEPIYITYTTPPTNYFEQSFDKTEPTVPVLDEADHVVITPEFVDNVFSEETSKYGHYITTGTQINVRVTNHNNVSVTGSVNVEIPGFTVSGLDQTITVAAHSEGFITLTLTKNGSTDVDDIVTFTGTFNGKTCTPAAVSVYSGSQTDRGVSRSFQFTTNTWVSASNLSSVKMYVDGFEIADQEDIIILVNGEEFNGSFTYNSQYVNFNGDYRRAYVLTIDFSSLGDGKHTVSIGFKTDGGDIRVIPLTIRRSGNQVLFANVR